MAEAAVPAEHQPLKEQTPASGQATHARKNSQLNSAAPDFVPNLRCSVDRTGSGLDEVNFSPANGICTPSSTSCWFWDGAQWHVSPHMGKASPVGSSYNSPPSVLTPQTPQQSWRPHQQHPSPNSSDSTCTDGGLASDGSMSGCSSGTPCPPASMLCAMQQPGSHASPFCWPQSPQGPHPPPPSPMGYPCMGPPPGPPAHGMVQHPHLPPGYMPAPPGAMLPGMLLPPSPLRHCLQSPLMTPHPLRRPPWHGGMAHGLQPMMMPPPTPQFLCVQPVSPSYNCAWQPATPCQSQEPGPHSSRQRHAGFTPRSAHRRPTRMGSSSIDSSQSASPPEAMQPAAPPHTPMAAAPFAQQHTPAASKRTPLKELSIVVPEGQPSPRACSPMRKPSGISAADTQAIAAVLEKADLLGDEVPKQVEELKALVSSDGQEPINARHRRTLRRAMQRAAKALGMEQAIDVAMSGSVDSLEGRSRSCGEIGGIVPDVGTCADGLLQEQDDSPASA